jgi:heat shock protein HtpX
VRGAGVTVVSMWASRRATWLGGGVTLTTWRAGPVRVFVPGQPRNAMMALAAANTSAAASASAPAVPMPARYARVARIALSIGIPAENLSPNREMTVCNHESMPNHPPKSIGSDRGLKARVAFTALLLVALYVLLITLLVAAGLGVVGIAVLLAVLVLAHYLGIERLVLSALGARPVGPGQMPELHAAMERVCVLAERPMVRLAIIDSALPSAYTVGRSPLNATICVTSALHDLLDGPELDAVLAHELAHVASRTVVLMTLASVWAALAAHLVRLADRLLPSRPGREREPWGGVVILAGLLFVVSYVTTQALSRRRQLAADRAACLLMGGSEALGSALRASTQGAGEFDTAARRAVCGELTALSLIAVDAPGTLATMFPTHPPLALRLARLSQTARELLATA